ncbi:ankyrin repeat-containing protein [Tanacetum coccineum]|uniref:Ankyrin repeat-containing protein n=1 Tax=Tanacetum coccineum TaxID=301880 RepID=A0ABQ4ZIV2_9ASTR
MTNKKVTELDAEFIEYKAEAKASMDALEKKIDDGIGKLDASIKAMKEESDAKFEELKQLILGTSTHVDVPQTTKSWDVKGSNKLDPRKMNDMIRERFKSSTDSGAVFVEGMQPTGFKGFRREFEVDSQATVDREMQHMMGTNQTGERVHRGARTNQAGDIFAYHGFEHRMRKLKMPVFEGEDAYGWIYRVERYFKIQGLTQQEQLRATSLCMEAEALSWYRWGEGRTPFHSWDGFKRRLLIRFQQSKEGNLYEQFLAITQEGSARAYVALFEKLACQLVGVPKTVMEATFTKGLKPALRAAIILKV